MASREPAAGVVEGPDRFPVAKWLIAFAGWMFGSATSCCFPVDARNLAMDAVYNSPRVQLFAPVVVGSFVARYGLRGALGLPMVLAPPTARWVWTLSETRKRDLAAIERVRQEPMPETGRRS